MTLWAVACQASLSIEFPRQEYWSGYPFASPRDLCDPGVEPRSPALQEDSSPSEPQRERLSTNSACKQQDLEQCFPIEIYAVMKMFISAVQKIAISQMWLFSI